MAKRSHMNPAQDESEQREIKKAKEHRQEQKLERLKTVDPGRLQRRIDELEAKKERNGGKLWHEERTLESMKRDLEAVKKLRLGGVEGQAGGQAERSGSQTGSQAGTPKPQPLGSRSIFYHPQWNVKGEPPFGLPNVEFDGVSTNTSDKPLDIPLPKGPKPKFYKIEVHSIEREADVKPASGTSFIPSTIQRKRKLNQ
ncbi:hypothetical protein BN1211_1619 [Cyberlindnera jadinii]|uniref:Wbp11/ELF5/Saf1 N-terminal domain-containing protein n=1 Tax=Cyberlindnera jadinii (strain ATCC 18201 / CBS 1600 / BCRC 20928 / JCM 3617 / NBRC 0987 / NRRL Y-1542) TaxID=983966 RepID=A0A0H5C124_CYBJN|nr:hypothetical protein BN1211_1619 [Cyberlindnera jadinii]